MSSRMNRNSLEDLPFAFSTSKDGSVFITWNGKQVSVLKGDRAAAFLSRVSDAQKSVQQLEMARITGNFKRGNERQGGAKT